MQDHRHSYTFRRGAFRVASADGLLVVRPWGRRAGAWDWQRGCGVDPIEPYLDISLLRDPDPPDVCFRYDWEADWVYAADPRLRRAILETIPTLVRDLVAAVEPRSQWRMLQFINRAGSPALQLASSSPALALLVANEEDEHIQRNLTSSKRCAIAHYFGFEAEGATAVLAKLAPSALHAESLRLLHGAQRQPDVWKLCLHLPRLTAILLELLSERELLRRTRHSFLVDLSSSDDRTDTVERLRELTRLDQHIGRRRPRFRTVEELDQAHDDHVERLQLSFATGHFDDVAFPAAPVEGTESIQYIATGWDLMREGNALHHCVGSYLQSAMEGNVACYRILAPERATLKLRRCEGGWVLDEISRFANAEVGSETVSAVRTWFESAPGPRSGRHHLELALWQRPDDEPYQASDLDEFRWLRPAARELRGSGEVFDLDETGLREILGSITVGEAKRLLGREDGCAAVYAVRRPSGCRPAIIEIFRGRDGFWDHRVIGGVPDAQLDRTVRRWIMRAYLHDETVPAIDFFNGAA